MFGYNSVIRRAINGTLDLEAIYKSSERLFIYVIAMILNFAFETSPYLTEADKASPEYKEWESRKTRVKKVRYIADLILDAYMARCNA